MIINLAPWYYRELLSENTIVEAPLFFEVNLLNGIHQFETSVSLKNHLRPAWLKKSKFYRNTDGSGTAKYKNVAVYKGVSEALERWAFYETVDLDSKKYRFDENPTTTGMAAFPYFNAAKSRRNAKAEAVERWALHEFNRFNLPLKQHKTSITNLRHFQIMTPFQDVDVSLLEYWNGEYYCYGFAGGNRLDESFFKALVELDRNLRVLRKVDLNKSSIDDFQDTVDRTLFYFSTIEGNLYFQELIAKSAASIKNDNPKILCDVEIPGPWSKYTRVWRYLLEDSYFDCRTDHKFFMF